MGSFLKKLAAVLFLLFLCSASVHAETWTGEKSDFHGFDQYDFSIDDLKCRVVVPKEASAGKPWVWRARFFGHQPQVDVALLEKGFHVAYVDVSGLFGSPKAVARWNNFYNYLVNEKGFSKMPALEGMSRGGLIIYNWAAQNPEKVACIYADAPVCDIKSWPNNNGGSEEGLKKWNKCLEAYGFTEAEALVFAGNPLDNLAPLAANNVPLLHVVGDADEVVPVDENTAIMESRYRKLGGSIEVIHKPGGHHPHCLRDPGPIVNFILKHALSPSPSTSAADPPPNVVLIFADDLGYGDLGCYGATKIKTPNIDQLAAQGRRFTDAHSASAVCTPSRYGLLTGQYPLRAFGGKGSWGPLPTNSGLIIDTDTLTIGKLFQNKGYATACLGKWHLGFKEGENDWQVPLRPGPQDVGFDHYFGVPLVNSGSPFVYVEDDTYLGYDPNDPLEFGGTPISPTPTFPKEASRKSPNKFGGALKAHQIYDDEKTGTLLTQRAVKWIAEKKEQPFFLFLSTPNIHHPFTPDPRFKGTSDCGLYGDFVHELDWMVGEVIKSLEDNGLSENTLVIFTSDNGAMLNRAGRDAVKAGHKINGDLLGFKFGVWEGGHRVPMIAKWPGRIKEGTQSTQLISQIDMLATFTALTGQDEKTLEGKDSINMLPALLDDPTESLRTELLLAPRQSRKIAIRKGKWVYIGAKGSGGFSGAKPNHHAWGGPPAAAFAGSINSDIEGGRLKKNAPPAQLYDLEADPNQTKNLHNQHPEVVQELSRLLASYGVKPEKKPVRRNNKKKALPKVEKSAEAVPSP